MAVNALRLMHETFGALGRGTAQVVRGYLEKDPAVTLRQLGRQVPHDACIG